MGPEIIALLGLLEEVAPLIGSVTNAVKASFESGAAPSTSQLEDAHAATQRVLARGDAIMAEIQRKRSADAGNQQPAAPAAPPPTDGNA